MVRRDVEKSPQQTRLEQRRAASRTEPLYYLVAKRNPVVHSRQSVACKQRGPIRLILEAGPVFQYDLGRDGRNLRTSMAGDFEQRVRLEHGVAIQQIDPVEARRSQPFSNRAGKSERSRMKLPAKSAKPCLELAIF